MSDKTQEYRENFRLEMIPSSYSPWRHAFVNFAPLFLVLYISLWRLQNVKFYQLLMIPIMMFVGNLVVYLIHKYPLHRPWIKYTYTAHSIWHHRFYTYDYPTYDTPRDFHVIFFPTWVMIFFTFLFLGPISWLLPPFIGYNLTQFFIFSSALYFIMYEVTHLISHLKEDHPLLKIKPLRYMRDFHRLHHDPKLMSKHNFGIVFPFWDWILKTHFKGHR